MKLQIVAIAGALKGQSWPVDTPLVFGREFPCRVRLTTPLASRRHCQLVPEQQGLSLEDLGSLNPALVNGTPSRSGNLQAGDTIAIGEELFLVAHARPGKVNAVSQSADDDTRSLGGLLSPPWERHSEDGAMRGISTTEHLAFLFDTSHALASCRGLKAALDELVRRLDERFSPDGLWVIRAMQGRSGLHCYPLTRMNPEEASLPSTKVVRAAMGTGQGTVTQQQSPAAHSDELRTSLVAPLSVAGLSTGAIVLQRGFGRVAYTESDARFLETIACAVAPFLHSAEVIGRLERETTRLRRRAGEASELVGQSPVMQRLREQLAQAAQTELSVLLCGETGTGKEVAARILHAQSARSEGAFVVVNCAAIPDELFESQVFGHQAGAFTGAQVAFDGLFVRADMGTLFLDEIGDLSPHNQARILRAVETGMFCPVGASEETVVDVRVVSATNKDLNRAIRDGTFRQDLYHRINGFELHIPPLRERVADIAILARHFFDVAKETARRPLIGFTPEALHDLELRGWPGNVRELRNCVLRAIGTVKTELIQAEDLRLNSLSLGDAPADLSLDAWEKHHIITVLQHHNGNVREAAKALGVGRSTLYKKLADHGVST